LLELCVGIILGIQHQLHLDRVRVGLQVGLARIDEFYLDCQREIVQSASSSDDSLVFLFPGDEWSSQRNIQVLEGRWREELREIVQSCRDEVRIGRRNLAVVNEKGACRIHFQSEFLSELVRWIGDIGGMISEFGVDVLEEEARLIEMTIETHRIINGEAQFNILLSKTTTRR